MAAYLARRILEGKLEYENVIKAYKEFETDINSILKAEGRKDLIT